MQWHRAWPGLLGIALLVTACGGSSSHPDAGRPDAGPLFPPRPECSGEALTPLAGQHPMIISFLEIGKKADGFDLDHDGNPDNKLAGVGAIAKTEIQNSFKDFTIIIAFEFFDFATVAADPCLKFAIYYGAYRMDEDGDTRLTARQGGDCNDHDETIYRGAAEVPDNGKDDDCDGLADETEEQVTQDGGTSTVVVPSENTDDADGDGVTIKDGDCDDTNPAVKGHAFGEVCGDGFDNDCDGAADFGYLPDGTPACTPFDETPDLIALDPLSFHEDGSAVIEFRAGSAFEEAGQLKMEAGPSLFSVSIPVMDNTNLELRISGATIVGDLVPVGDDYGIANGRLGGVLDANTLDKITGLDVSEIGLKPEDTLLDAVFGNILGVLLGLPRPTFEEHPDWTCATPDIDVDGDGIETFCDTDGDKTVDLCIDGDGTEVLDGAEPCTAATNGDGSLRFVDGVSVELNFSTVPVILPESR